MTQLRTTTQADLVQLLCWAQDTEVAALDPAAGPVIEPLMWSIYTDNGTLIGLILLYNRQNATMELGIRIGEKAYWSQGHGTWAVNEVLKYAFGPSMWLTKVHLKVLPTNIRAIRCYEKCGFVVVGSKVVDGILFTHMEVSR